MVAGAPIVAGLQHAVQCLELPCYRRVLLWLQACSNAVQSFPTAAAGAWVCSRCRTAECRCSRDRPRPSRGARLVAATAFIVAALACEVVVTAPAAARVAAHLPSVEAAHPEKRSGQRNRRRSAAAWCRLPRRYSFGGGATLVDAMLAHDGSACRRATLRRSSIVDLIRLAQTGGITRAPFQNNERFFRKLRRQDNPP